MQEVRLVRRHRRGQFEVKAASLWLCSDVRAGKSTILRVIAGLERADARPRDAGREVVDHVHALLAKSVVIPALRLVRHMTVAENVAFA